MASRQINRQLQQMRRDWDQRARENARYYVATGNQQWSEEEFYRTGETTVEQYILNDLDNVCQGKDPKDMKVLEIGCGAGRITRAMAGLFGQVYAVDISHEMVRLARAALRQFPNARVFRNSGKDLSVVRNHWWNRFGFGERVQLDFAFSVIVFQHIPSPEIVENYVREVNRLLRPGGLFKFQVQGKLRGCRPRPKTVGSACRSPRARPGRWRSAAGSKCATTTAPVGSTTGSGSSSERRQDRSTAKRSPGRAFSYQR